MIEEEVAVAQRAFSTAQAELSGEVVEELAGTLRTGWHDIDASPLRGCFALVQRGGDRLDLRGKILRVTNGDREVFVFVLGQADLPPGIELSLARRPALHLFGLAAEFRDCVAGVV